MRKLWLLVGLIACSHPAPQAVQVDTVRVVDSACVAQLKTERILVSLAEQQMNHYATIVARDPSQAKFLVGWTRRAFSGVQ